MFLALREIRHQPTRFVLVVAVIALVSYLTFFLAALAVGLAHSYRSAIDHWDATDVVLTDASNRNIVASRLTQTQLDAVPASASTTTLVSGAVVAEDTQGAKTDATAFGIHLDSFLLPALVEGTAPSDPTRQVIADDSLKDQGWEVGRTFTLTGSDHQWA